MFLNRHGLETEIVDNGQKAVDLFVSGKSYDLVLMDLEMPVMNGEKATKKLRAMGVKSMIVGVTSCAVEEERAAFVAAGLDDCVAKPLTGGAVIDLLDELAKRVL
ncbi:two-component response regulator arr22 [Phtheirospermum japonicum]|uniref:Two-component response regulator arr22 n=1 Tax=Phtheirospermum japonicum TaxID=374723 RepID=A0A830B7G5_9LAMI|nr:two-component response regulator arr22 [Phtheirospermum japonicum]